MMKNNFMRILLPAIPANKEVVCKAIISFAENLNHTLDDLKRIEIAVEEAVNNCVCYAYPDSNYGDIYITCKVLKNNKLSIIIKDYGVGIKDVNLAKKSLYTTGDKSQHNGMGITVMEAMVDECDISSVYGKGTTVKIKKYFGK